MAGGGVDVLGGGGRGVEVDTGVDSMGLAEGADVAIDPSEVEGLSVGCCVASARVSVSIGRAMFPAGVVEVTCSYACCVVGNVTSPVLVSFRNTLLSFIAGEELEGIGDDVVEGSATTSPSPWVALVLDSVTFPTTSPPFVEGVVGWLSLSTGASVVASESLVAGTEVPRVSVVPVGADALTSFASDGVDSSVDSATLGSGGNVEESVVVLDASLLRTDDWSSVGVVVAFTIASITADTLLF